MQPTKTDSKQQELFKAHFNFLIDKKDPLIILSDSLDWDKLDKVISPLFKKGPGRPPKPVRLMVGILILQHINGISDEKVINIVF